jgi:hypothetical protein
MKVIQLIIAALVVAVSSSKNFEAKSKVVFIKKYKD